MRTTTKYRAVLWDYLEGQPGGGGPDSTLSYDALSKTGWFPSKQNALIAANELNKFGDLYVRIEEVLCGMRLVVCGPSGIAKSIIMKLLTLLGVDPKRVRKPRTGEDPNMCMDPDAFNNLKAQLELRPGGPIYKTEDLSVYRDWAIFRIRQKDWQALPLEGAFKDAYSDVRVEVFAPVLVDLLIHHAQLRDAFSLEPENVLVILLNPTGTSYRDMTAPTEELRTATRQSIRDRLQVQWTNSGKEGEVQISKEQELDISNRVGRHLDEELVAWRQFWDICTVAECKAWSHFEAQCILDSSGRERLAMKRDLLQAVGEQAPAFLDAVRSAFKPDSQILEESRSMNK